MACDPRGARVSVTTHPMWRIRLTRELPRYLLGALSLMGLAASARFAIAPPRAIVPAATVRAPVTPDRSAESYAVLFARRYLSWSAAEPQASARMLESFLGSGMEAGAGLELPASGERRVEWAEVVQAREPLSGEHLYTVAAQTDTAGLLYLTVPVTHLAGGALSLAGYPAFVGAPVSAPALPQAHLREVTEAALATVVDRALRNYLAGSPTELEADLTSEARVSLPALALSLLAVQRLDWSEDGGAVVATVQAEDAQGVHYTLGYELDVVREQGRWEISAVQTDPYQ
jgi:hypothetical protein